jgi:anti-anti-sigma factor
MLVATHFSGRRLCRFELVTVGEFQEQLDALVDGTGRRLLVDLSRVEFIDSMGITTLYQASASFAHLAITVMPGSEVARILELCGMKEMLPLFDSRAEAVRALA